MIHRRPSQCRRPACPELINHCKCVRALSGVGHTNVKPRRFFEFVAVPGQVLRSCSSTLEVRSMIKSIFVGWLCLMLFSAAGTTHALAQLAPTGQHYAGRPTDTGYGRGFVAATGTFR